MQINLRKAMFVLPNLFTVSSIFLGFYALVLCAGDATPEQLYQAALAIFFALFFDAFDGRVARMTKTQSDFGVQLDSLADVDLVRRGARPARLQVGARPARLPRPVRLVLLRRLRRAPPRPLQRPRRSAATRAPPASSSGSPSRSRPGPSSRWSSPTTEQFGATTDPATRLPIALVVALLSFLMVSTIRYRTFKDLHLSTAEPPRLRRS